MKTSWIVLLFIHIGCWQLGAQPLADTTFRPKIASMAYPGKNGPVVYIDQGHYNFHTLENSFKTFANLLKRDGYQIEVIRAPFTSEVLMEVGILVIPNAESAGVTHPIVTPTESAFTLDEVRIMKQWVEEGGALFLIADHMPFAGAAASLAAAFGFEFYDSFVMTDNKKGVLEFSIKDQTLTEGVLTGRDCPEERLKKVRSYTGQAFRYPKDATSILNLTEELTVYLPDTMWVINDEVEQFSAKGLSQGAIMPYGKGKIAVFGEAAMFTAQLAGRKKKVKVGMNAKEAPDNYRFLLNIIHWLDNVSLCEKD